MRVDDGAATATNNGNIEDRTTLKTNLSGVIVDDFGMPVQGFTVSAYGRTTTSGADGHWVMNDVPVTGVTVNSTAQNLEQTNLSTSGRIYVTYQKEGYATYHSRIDNAQAVITHYGTAGGNPNSIVVSNLVASDRVKIPALINSVTGILIDKGTLWDGTVGTYETAPAGVQVRLVPEVQASETAAGWALYGGSSCQTECGFFGLPEYVTQTDASGAFTFGNVAKLDGGYVLRIDNYGYRASERPNDVAGFSYNWDANNATSIYGGNFTPLNVTQGEWEITDDTLGIGFDVHGSNSIDKLINLGPLYIQDYLVANFNTVEGISVLDQTYNPNDDQGFTQDDGHNALDGATALDGGGVLVDSSIVSNLGTTAPLRFIFSGDMRALADLSGYPNGVIVFDGAGNRVSIDTSKTKLIGRVLELYSTSALTDGTYYVRLHRDVFVDMDAKRLETSDSANAGTPDFDPTDTTNTVPVAGGTDDTINLTDDKLYAEYKIVYTTVDVETTALSLAQSNITDATRQQIAATGGHLGMIGTELHVIDSTWKNSDGQIGDDNNEDDRLDILYNAIRDRYDEIYNDDNDVVVRTDVATVSFEVTKGKHYRVRVFDPNPSGDAFDASLVSVTNVTAAPAGTNGENNLADEDIDPTAGVNTGEVLVDNDGNPFAIWSFTALNTGTATVDLMDVGIGYKVAVVKANDFADFAAYDDAMTIELQDDLAPLVALQHSDRNGQDKTDYNADNAPHDNIGMLVEFGELRTDEAGEPINGDEKIYYPKLNLTASLYDECHKRAKSENINDNYDDSLQPLNVTPLDTYYNATPLLASSKTSTGACATLSSVGKTCSTGRSDNIYTSGDYDCWYGGTSGSDDTCQYYVADPGADSVYYSVTSSAGGITINSSSTAASAADITTAMITAGQYEIITFDNANTFASPVNSALDVSVTTGFKGHPTLGPTGCLAVAGTPADVVRNLVIDMTEATAAIGNSDDTTALQAAYEASGNIAAAATLADDSLGLLYLETPTQHQARASAHHADTAGSGISSRSNHLIATLGDWRTITETGRFLTANQDVVNGAYHEDAETYVIDSEADGADKKSILKLHGEKDGDNANLSIAAGHASGVLFVDATPALATSMSVGNGVVTMNFDQDLLGISSYTANAYIDLHGEDFVYRISLTDLADSNADGTADAPTIVRGVLGTDTAALMNDGAADRGDTSITIDGFADPGADPNPNTDDLLAGSKIHISENTTDTTTDAAAAVGDASISVDTTFLGAGGRDIAAGTAVTIGSRDYTVVHDETLTTAGSVVVEITPPLEAAVANGANVTFKLRSTHVVTADAAEDGGNVDEYQLTISPALPNDYSNGVAVTVDTPIFDGNEVVDGAAAGNAYTDVFGHTTDEFDGLAVANRPRASIAISGGTMTITASDDDANGDAIDMSGFFSDLSHTSTASAAGTNGTTPDLMVNYEDVQDPNYNSWAKVENYDQYDNSGTPRLVGADGLKPKLMRNKAGAAVGDTFLYAVSAPVTLVAAHANQNLTTDEDTIYTYDATADDAAGELNTGSDNEDDFPLFRYWGYDTTTASAVNATTDTTRMGVLTGGLAADGVRAVLKFSGATTITATAGTTQAYIYNPEDGDISADNVANSGDFIDSAPPVDDGAGGATLIGDALAVNTATVTTTNASAPAIVVGIPNYGTIRQSDRLVIEDIDIDGIVYTIHIAPPEHVAASNGSNLLETSQLPNVTFYREVSFAGDSTGGGHAALNLLPNAATDAVGTNNLRAGQAVNSTFTQAYFFQYREELSSVTAAISYAAGADHDTVNADQTSWGVASAQLDNSGTGTGDEAEVTFTYGEEATTKYIGHGATFTVTAADQSSNSSSFTVTLNLGHGVANASDEDAAGGAEIASPILNIISGDAVDE
jgi:hypothetical protein